MAKGSKRGGKKAIEKAKRTVAKKKAAAAETVRAAAQAPEPPPPPPDSSYARGAYETKPATPKPAASTSAVMPSAAEIAAILNSSWVKGPMDNRKDKK